ncbi:MAG: replicative DNA helicase [Coriobacteriales bacterium]|jgi:replicative DNA helicase|nr:replicative DNA helicase [Coriobacteriales bacterium]
MTEETYRRPEPPHSIDAETAVLAAMILDKNSVLDALASVNAEHFFRPRHQTIYTAIQELAQRNAPVDLLTLADHLQAKGDLERVGGKVYLAQLADNAFAISNWENHAEIVKRHALMRELIRVSDTITSLGYSQRDDLEGVIEEAEKALFEVTNKKVDANFKDIKELVMESSNLLELMGERKNQIVGVPTGFHDLDRLLFGLRGGDLIVLAARPGIGKSALALNIAVHAARKGNSVAFFSLEMPSVQLTQRIISAEASVDSYKMRSGNLSDSDWKNINEVCNDLMELNFAIDDSPGLTLIELRAKARRQLRDVQENEGLIVVDYLQLMESHGPTRDRHLEVAEFSRGLKILAKELKVPVLALSQLSRMVESRKDKRPQLSDLRESGSIEQDADVVIFIDRSMSEEEALSKGRPELGTARLIVGKNRNGATRDIDVAFDSNHTRFRDLAPNPGSYSSTS